MSEQKTPINVIRDFSCSGCKYKFVDPPNRCVLCARAYKDLFDKDEERQFPEVGE